MSDLIFKTVPISRAAALVYNLRRHIQMKRYAAVLVERGEVLGFLLSECPKTVPVEQRASASFIAVNLNTSTMRQWQRYDCVDLTLHTRSIAVFVPAKHQGWLPIPVFKEAVN